MPRAPDETVRGRLTSLDDATLTEFVAAVYAARGWAVERDGDAEGDALWATPSDAGRPRRLTVGGDAADAVTVTVRHGDDVTTLDAADIGRMAWYALDAAARTRLFRDFFDADPDDIAVPTSVSGDDAGDATARTTANGRRDGDNEVERTVDGLRSDAERDPPDGTGEADDGEDGSGFPVRRALAAGLAIALVVAGVAAAGPALTSSGIDGADGANDTDGADDTDRDYSAAEAATARLDTGVNGTADEETVTPGMIAVPSVPKPRPPGVSAAGVVNVSALTDAHAATMSNGSYRLTVHHREFVDGTPAGFVRERTVVENATRYRTDLRWVGTVRQDPQAIGNTSAFADGQARYVRLAGESGATVETELRPTDRFAGRSERYFRETLTGSATRVAGAFEQDGTTRFWITVGRNDGGTTASLLVDERGLVHELHHRYVYRPSDGPSVRVVVTMRVTPGNVSTSPPPWVDDVR